MAEWFRGLPFKWNTKEFLNMLICCVTASIRQLAVSCHVSVNSGLLTKRMIRLCKSRCALYWEIFKTVPLNLFVPAQSFCVQKNVFSTYNKTKILLPKIYFVPPKLKPACKALTRAGHKIRHFDQARLKPTWLSLYWSKWGQQHDGVKMRCNGNPAIDSCSYYVVLTLLPNCFSRRG